MPVEVGNRSSLPYAATALIVATYSNGTMTFGTGALVGRNDLLTATHVIYDPDHGGWARELDIYFGVDFNAAAQRFESASLYPVTHFGWRAEGFPEQVFVDGDHATLTRAESQYDVALVGLSEPVGDELGWFALGGGHDATEWASQLGYPVEGSGLMVGSALVTRAASHSVYAAYAVDGSDIMGAGSSGGPLYLELDGVPTIIGVKTSGGSDTSYWADIGLTLESLQQAIVSNHDVLFIDAVPVPGSDGNDYFESALISEAFAGGAGLDTVAYAGARDQYRLAHNGSGYWVEHRSLGVERDVVSDVERLIFADYQVELRIPALAARLSRAEVDHLTEIYIAYFNRIPEAEGLAYWLDVRAKGASFEQIADDFYWAALAWSELTGYHADQEPPAFIETIYRNVLGRDSVDPGGMDFWLSALATGQASRASLISSIVGAAHTYADDPQWGWVPSLLDNKVTIGRAFAVEMALSWLTPATSIVEGMAVAAAVTPTDVGAAIALIGLAPEQYSL